MSPEKAEILRRHSPCCRRTKRSQCERALAVLGQLVCALKDL